MSRLQISHAKELAKKSNQEIVVIFGYDKDGVSHITTWGRNKDQCSIAADLGNKMKRGLDWPESLCNAQPSRVRRLQDENAKLEAENEKLMTAVKYQAEACINSGRECAYRVCYLRQWCPLGGDV